MKMRDLLKSTLVIDSLSLLSQAIFVVFLIQHRVNADAFQSSNSVQNFRTDERPSPKYKYSYNVRNLEGGQHGHQVTQDGLYSSGKYYVNLDGGISQNVEYYTDHLGYHPKVTYSSKLESGGGSGARVAFNSDASSFTNYNKIAPKSTTYEKPYSPNVLSTTETLVPSSTSNAIDVTSSSNEETHPKVLLNEHFGERIQENHTSEPNATAIINEFLRNYEPSNASTPVDSQPFVYNIPSTNPISSILLSQPSGLPLDAYLQPEINEITNGFLGKIVSVAPSIKLFRPIIVTDNFNANSAENATAEAKPDQAVDSAQLHEYRDLSIYEDAAIESDNNTKTVLPLPERKPENKEHSITIVDPESEKAKTIVDVEPQTVEEQAVITTTIDIAKSLPLAVNFAQDVDNHLNEAPSPPNLAPSVDYRPNDSPQSFNYVPTTNLLPAPQQVPFLPPPGMFLAPHPTVAAYHAPRYLQFPVAPNLQPRPTIFQPLPPNAQPLASFRYISIPVYQHQPNVIPLHYVAGHTSGSGHITAVPPQELISTNFSRPVSDTTLQEPSNTDESVSKRENHSNTPSTIVQSVDYQLQKFAKPQPFHNDPQPYDVRKPSTLPYAITVPPAHLIPYVKQSTNFPSTAQSHPLSQYLQKQPGTGVPRAYSVSYNLKSFPKDARKGHPKSTPFKPSHPVWDSIYPPQHMYYVPYYVLDKVPHDRKARESSGKRNRRYLRRLFVEYGGFKPPMIPSTLLETEETDNKANVPSKESLDES